jgi:hypothetical protein
MMEAISTPSLLITATDVTQYCSKSSFRISFKALAVDEGLLGRSESSIESVSLPISIPFVPPYQFAKVFRDEIETILKFIAIQLIIVQVIHKLADTT